MVGARKAGQVADESIEPRVAEEIELDVRGVKGGEALAALPQPGGNRRQCARAAEIADDRYHQIALLQDP